jgi:hypothetical protein
MTSRPATASPISIKRRELLLWLFWSGVAVTFTRYFNIGNAEQFWHQLNQINLFLVGAICVAGCRLYRFTDESAARWPDIIHTFALLGILFLATLLPRLIGIGVYFFCLAVFLNRFEDRSRELFACAVVLFAVTTHLLFAPVIFRSFLSFFVWLDAQFVGHVLQFLTPDFQWHSSHFTRVLDSGKFGIVLAGACSSFNAVSAAVMIHIAWAMALRKSLTKWDAVALVATLFIATALNVARLVVSAMGPEDYAFWHGNSVDGMPVGAMIFIVVQNLAFIIAGYATARWAGKSEP